MTQTMREHFYQGFLALSGIMLAGKWFDRLQIEYWHCAALFFFPVVVSLLWRAFVEDVKNPT